MDFRERNPRNVEGHAPSAHDQVDPAHGIAENAAAAKRQKFVLFAGGSLIALAGVVYIIGDGKGGIKKSANSDETVQVSTDAIMNRQRAEQEWMAMYERQQIEQGNQLKGMQGAVSKVDQVQDELQALRQENAQVKTDAARVLEAYERENRQLRQQVGSGAAQALPAAGAAAAARAMGVPVDSAAMPRLNEVKLVSFEAASPAAAAGDGRRIEASGKQSGGAGKQSGTFAGQAALYTDSPNYLPPNSIAQAKVVVGVDAATNVKSQSDPLPVLLRVTGPARSVFSDGRLLRTRVQGCMVNGAAYGDLSTEKVYVKLQRMTCPQPGGRYAVSEVKGFISFGGKVGLRGRVVSREGGLIGQAFLAGVAGGFGRGFSANANSVFSGTNVSVEGKREALSPGEIVKGGLGEGIASAGDTVSDYLIERAEQYQPVIEMPTGADVEVVFLEGTFIRN